MRLLTVICVCALLLSCSSDPVIIPDTTSDNVVMLDIKDRLAQPGVASYSYGWLFWYAPLASLLVLWGYRNLIKKPIDCIEQEPDSVKIQEKIDDNPKT